MLREKEGVIMEQMSIFDIVPPPDPDDCPDFRYMSAQEIAEFIGKELRIEFKPDSRFHGYVYKTNTFILQIDKDKYDYPGHEGEPFISIDISYTKAHYCSSVSTDSLEDAITLIRRRTK